MDIIQKLTQELEVKRWQVEAAIQLIDEGCTIPFISRYRKEVTGSLNDEQLRKLYERLQYLRNLERCFDSNEYINIRFANNDIVKAGVGGEVYGIQIKQDYYSTNYGDTGYLFLMVDLNDPKKPIIKVRSWQPERDPNFGLVDLSHF